MGRIWGAIYDRNSNDVGEALGSKQSGPACLIAHHPLGALAGQNVYWQLNIDAEFLKSTSARECARRFMCIPSPRPCIPLAATRDWEPRIGVQRAMAQATALWSDRVPQCFSWRWFQTAQRLCDDPARQFTSADNIGKTLDTERAVSRSCGRQRRAAEVAIVFQEVSALCRSWSGNGPGTRTVGSRDHSANL